MLPSPTIFDATQMGAQIKPPTIGTVMALKRVVSSAFLWETAEQPFRNTTTSSKMTFIFMILSNHC
jgi:hypothetical protein